jgi:hypothetical protein
MFNLTPMYLFCLLIHLQRMQPNSSEAGQEQQQQQVEVRGWIRTVRQQKQFAFMQVCVLKNRVQALQLALGVVGHELCLSTDEGNATGTGVGAA